MRRVRASWKRRGVSPERAVAIAHHHVTALVGMDRLGDAAMRASDVLGRIKLVHRQRISQMANAVYSRSRKVAEEDWPMAFASVAERYVGEGVDRASVLAAMEACWDALPHSLHDVKFAAVLEFVKEGAEMKEVNTKGTKNTKRAEVKLQNAKCKVQSAEAKRKASGVKRKASSASIDKPSPLEVFTWNRAQEQLRFALAGLDPIVKRCVSFRLLRRDSYKKLAEELEVSLDDVREILACLRGRVHKYTTYFDRDWYWDESAKRFSLPEAT